ncbi:hypothetical protein Ahy_A03g014133 [Arachis hypogaea]|uniref:Uncharacterized protein n=1 Tax=Arachis hypogaea TaxID=3818 RepID=A0A445DX41_ARAHY|nr:hypothetical protein Ahy_A03g014133 [Arachis hypogaea]
MSKGAQISHEQSHDRTSSFSSSTNSAPTSRINEPLCVLRNDRRLRHQDKNYNPKADEIELFDDHIDNLFAAQEVEGQNNDNKRKDTDYWEVIIIEDGMTKGSKLGVKEVIALPPDTKVILLFNKELQPTDQATGLLRGFLGSLDADYSQFFICKGSWKNVNKANKEHAYNMVKVTDNDK